MRITYFSNFHDISVAVYDDPTYEQLCSVFDAHEIQTNKDGMMFNLCQFKDDTGIRCSDNVACYHGLLLDYDGNGATIQKVIERFDGFQYLGYTSYNHVVKGVDKFRLVFPFTHPCPKDEWELRKENFLTFAGPEIDRSCVSHSRSFYLPSCCKENAEYADRWFPDGEVLDWEMFIPIRKVYPTQSIQKPVSITTLQKALDELQKHRNILPNEDRYWIVRAVAKCVGTRQAIVECRSRWNDAPYNGKYEQQVKNLHANGPGLGGIIFEIRKYNPTYEVMSKEEWKSEQIQDRLQQKYGDQHGN